MLRQPLFSAKLKSVATKFSLSRRGWLVRHRDTVFWGCDRAGLSARCCNRAHAQRVRHGARRAFPVRATRQCCLVARCTVLGNCLNYSAFALFMGNVKKKYKNDPRYLGDIFL